MKISKTLTYQNRFPLKPRTGTSLWRPFLAACCFYVVLDVWDHITKTLNNGLPFRLSAHTTMVPEAQMLSSLETIKFIKANRTTVAPKLLNLSALSDSFMSPLAITVQDDGPGVYGGIIIATCPSLRPVEGSFRVDNYAAAGRPVNVIVSFSPSTHGALGKQGAACQLEVMLGDDWGNTNRIQSGAGNEQRLLQFPWRFGVPEPLLDDTAPPYIVTERKLWKGDIDVSALHPKQVSLEIAAADDLSGIAWGRVYFDRVGKNSTLDVRSKDLSVTKGRILLQNVSFPLQQIYEPGMHSLHIVLSDMYGNQKHHRIELNLVNSRYSTDDASLKLHDFAAIKRGAYFGVNVTDRPVAIKMSLVVRSSFNRMAVNGTVTMKPRFPEHINVDLIELSMLTFSATCVMKNLKAGKSASCTMTLWVPQFFYSGAYDISVCLNDDRVETKGYDGISFDPWMLMQRNFPHNVHVRNSNRDLTPPQLVDFVALTPRLIASDDRQATVEMLVTAQDDKSGVKAASVTVHYGENSTLVDTRILRYSKNATNTGDLVELRLGLNFTGTAVCRDAFEFTLSLSDHAGNIDHIDSTMLLKRGFPGIIQVRRLCLARST